MRDVDLFVASASIGMDVNSAGIDTELLGKNYLDSAVFKEFPAQSKVRAEVLEGLIPKLVFSSQLHLDGNFLVVVGRINKYKIHLGSANVMFAETETQLRLPDIADKLSKVVVLPFQGDARLTQILNRAHMLCNDDAIKDRSILDQFPAL